MMNIQAVIDNYADSDFENRLYLFLIHRDLREAFAEIEEREVRFKPAQKQKPAADTEKFPKSQFSLCGCFRRV